MHLKYSFYLLPADDDTTAPKVDCATSACTPLVSLRPSSSSPLPFLLIAVDLRPCNSLGWDSKRR